MYKNTFENINFWRCHQFRKNAYFLSHCLQWVLAVPFAKNSSHLGFWQHWRKRARERNTPSQIPSQQWLPGSWHFKVPPPGRQDCAMLEKDGEIIPLSLHFFDIQILSWVKSSFKLPVRCHWIVTLEYCPELSRTRGMNQSSLPPQKRWDL